MRTLIILIIVLSPYKYDEVIRDKSDFVEINHYYQYNHTDRVYEKQFIQVIWWEFRGGLFIDRKGEIVNRPISDFVVRDFRITWSKTSQPQDVNRIIPRYYTGNWGCVFYDKNGRVVREVTSKWRRVTHTTIDPEMINRNVINEPRRNKLSNVK